MTRGIMVIDPKIDINNVLECPSCNESNLHQTSVGVFFRKEDSDDGVFKKIDNTGVQYANPSRNPSTRRDGLLISFVCEHCTADPELAIYQHKGSTFVEWNAVRTEIK
jgi:hypothetical protein